MFWICCSGKHTSFLNPALSEVKRKETFTFRNIPSALFAAVAMGTMLSVSVVANSFHRILWRSKVRVMDRIFILSKRCLCYKVFAH